MLVPLSGNSNAGPFWVGSQAPLSISQAPRALFYWVGPNYLQTMQIPLLRGRFLTPHDTVASAPVVAIDSVLAHAYFGGQDPVGRVIHIPHWGDAQIVGVVAHVRHWGLDDTDLYTQNQIYASFYQLKEDFVPAFLNSVTVAVRTPLDPAVAMAAIKSVVAGLTGGEPVYRVQTMRQIVSQSLQPQRFPLNLLAAFAALALLLSCIGIYGVVSYITSQRLREMGIRMALGAEKSDVVRLLLGRGIRLALPGIVIGAAAAILLARLSGSFSHLLYQVNVADPVTLLAASSLLLITALLACYLPARRASKTDPMTSLRNE